MPKIKTLKPLVSMMKPRLGYSTGNERERDKKRQQEQHWRKWYQTKEWYRLRQKAFTRDHYTCQRSGVLCIGKGNVPDAPVANHKVPHKGNRELFFNLDNIETVSKQVHDSIIQREEKSGRVIGSSEEGMPIDQSHHWYSDR
ncbi:HNH endonuclease [Brucella gallinifaecis]|uniref:HNH endonuclease n=1 Tax=Brucella gallinifaecis TaxID=215590 RepID=UPI0018751376|nr:HNH endonuclease [Brucella gallinifaecis]